MPFYDLPYHIGVRKGMEGHREGNGHKLEEGRDVRLHLLALLPNFDFYLRLNVQFHKLLFWVPILAAGGPYWVPISQKVGSLFQSLGVPISLCDSENAKKVPIWTQSL